MYELKDGKLVYTEEFLEERSKWIRDALLERYKGKVKTIIEPSRKTKKDG